TISIGDLCLTSDPNILWIGTGEHNARNSVSWGDGVYKSADAGKTWKHMGLKESFQIGRIAAHPKNPEIAYVGALGRLWGPNEQRGLYKTVDGGKTWEKILHVDENTGCADVALDPRDPNTILAAMHQRRRGEFDVNDPVKRWGPGGGLYRSTDGGRTWKRLTDGLPACQIGRIGLRWSPSQIGHAFALIETEQIGTAPPGSKFPAFMGIQGGNAEEGALLTKVNPKSPAHKAGLKRGDVIRAINGKPVANQDDMVQLIRKFHAGDEVTIRAVRDKKETLELKLTFGKRPGTPGGKRPFGGVLGGQIANVHEQQGEQGFQTGGLYKSTDAGETWTRINSLNPRPFYYSQIHVDPSDENYISVLGIRFHHSSDGGKTFDTNAGRGIHPDHHAMWINPRDGRHWILGGDGGLYVTHDRGANWEFIDDLPIGQFYDVGVDNRTPYRVYGGLQDNGTWGGPSALRGSHGPTAADWFLVGWGDGFLCRADPHDPDLIYFESQYGGMSRVHLRTGERIRIRPPQKKDVRYRFNWKTPLLLSHHNSRIFYAAGDMVFRSINRGEDLRPISPNITRTDQGSATALTESPLNPDVL
ncbi:MAG: PDZ domain-containing protein, partial [Planctomycetales bacterium]